MIQRGSRWPMIPESPPLAQTCLSHFLFVSLFCVCPTRARQFLFVFLQERERFSMEDFIWRDFLNHSGDTFPPPNHPSLHEEVNSHTFKKWQKLLKIGSQACSWVFFICDLKKKYPLWSTACTVVLLLGGYRQKKTFIQRKKKNKALIQPRSYNFYT